MENNTLLKKIAFIIVLGVFSLGAAFGQCLNDNNFHIALGPPPNAIAGTTNIGAGTYAEVPVICGETYTFSTCGTTFNTQLTGFEGALTTPVFFNDNNGSECAGTQASVTWPATFSGTLRIVLDLANCSSCQTDDSLLFNAFDCISIGSALLSYKQDNDLAFTSSATDMCTGDIRALTATPAGGVFSGAGVSGSTFTAPDTTAALTLTYTFGQCSVDQIINISKVPTVSVSGDAGYCTGSSVTITATATAGSGVIVSYQWKLDGSNIPGASGSTYDATVAGSYTVVVSNSNGCSTESSTKGVVEFLVPTVSILGLTSFCAGDTMLLIANATPGSGSISTYQWKRNTIDVGLNSPFHSVTSGGSYTVIVTNANNCSTESAVHDISVNPVPSVSTTATAITCNGLTDGTATATPVGGTPPYSLTWSTIPIQSTLIATNLSAGAYTISVSDINGCSVSSVPVTVVEPPPLQIALTDSTDASCDGVNNGSVTSIASVGPLPYQYSINGSAFQPSGFFGGLSAGFYTVLAQDGNGCQATTSVTLDNVTTVVLVLDSLKNISCNGLTDGFFSLNASGGTNPYSYSTDNIIFQASPEFANLSAANYTVIAKDAVGCQAIIQVNISQPAVLNVQVSSITNNPCNGDSTGAINISVSGGTPPYQYLWSDSSVAEDIAGLGAGTYGIIVTDNNGCVDSITTTLTDPDELLISLANLQNVTCNGATNGSININVTGGTSPYDYNWSNGIVTQNNTQISAGDYSVTVTDNNGCVKIDSFIITEPPALVLNIFGSDVTCAGNTNGSITLNATGGTPPYTYIWSNGDTTKDLSGIPEGFYSVLVTDANLCVTTTNYTISALSNIVLSSINTDISCFGAADGSVVLSVLGGVEPYSYLWSNGDTTQNLTGAIANSYSVSVTDSVGCLLTLGAILTEPSDISITTASLVHVLCNGDSTGSIDITISGGVPPYTFNWSNGNTTEDNLFIAAGLHAVTVTDANSCTKLDSFTITELPALVITVSSQDIVCFGDNDGSIDLDVSGGALPYSYNWSNGDATQDVNGLASGTYFFTVTDNNGCSFSSSRTINTLSNIAVIDSIGNISCNGANDGFISLTVTGGIDPYNFAWSNLATTKDIFGLGLGIYTVTITDDSSCSLIRSFTISEPGLLDLTALVNDIGCFGDGSGEINLSVVGGTTPYTYLWSDSSTNQDLIGLDGGLYTVIVTDNNGCVETLSVTVNEPDSIGLLTATENVSCNGGDNGAVFLTVVGGKPPYIYLWSNGASTQDLVNISSGNYRVTVTDNNGCSKIDSFFVDEPTIIVTSIVATNVTCYGESNGSTVLTVSGGTPPYKYLWSNFSTSKDLVNVPAGNYTVLVTDKENCLKTDTITIKQPTPIDVSAVLTNPDCFGFAQGSIVINVTGGTPGYLFSWNTGDSTQSLIGINSGNYFLTVTDTVGCTDVSSYSISQPDSLELTAQIEGIICNGDSTGSINIAVLGGLRPYAYSWSNGDSVRNISNLPAGEYDVVVTDGNGCILTDTFSVTEPNPLQTSVSITHVTCFGDRNGAVDLTVTGGKAPYRYFWSSFDFSQDLNGLAGGHFVVVVTDNNGCTIIDSATVIEPDSLTLVTLAKGLVCGQATGGNVFTFVNGGTRPYSYIWDDPTQSTDSVLTNVPPGLYSVTVTDTNACTVSSSEIIDPVFIPTVNFSFEDVCNNTPAKFENLSTVQGGSLTYIWMFGDGDTSSVENPSHTYPDTGLYTVILIAISNNDCSDTLSKAIRIFEVPDATILNSQGSEIICANESVTLSVATAFDLIYDWSTSAMSESIVVTEPGIYSVTVENAEACLDIDSVEIFFLDSLEVDISNDTTISLGFSVPLFATGGITYSWTPIDSLNNPLSPQPIANPTITTTYTVTVTDVNGCSVSQSVTITVVPDYNLGTLPNLFTPNGDGFNDTWKIQNITFYDDCEVAVFNRWGNLVFNAKGYNNDWDGTNDGKKLSDGTYYYVVICADQEPQKGAITILR